MLSSPRSRCAITCCALLISSCEAFSSSGGIPVSKCANEMTLMAHPIDRRSFVDAAAMFGVVSVSGISPVYAEESVDDLSMPSEVEQKAANEAAMAEKLRKKRELQQQATRPMSYGASMSKEKEKQSSLQMSKQERRNAMCEELGRGC